MAMSGDVPDSASSHRGLWSTDHCSLLRLLALAAAVLGHFWLSLLARWLQGIEVLVSSSKPGGGWEMGVRSCKQA